MATLLNTLLASLFSAFLATSEPVPLSVFMSYRPTGEVTVQPETEEKSYKVYFVPLDEDSLNS